VTAGRRSERPRSYLISCLASISCLTSISRLARQPTWADRRMNIERLRDGGGRRRRSTSGDSTPGTAQARVRRGRFEGTLRPVGETLRQAPRRASRRQRDIRPRAASPRSSRCSSRLPRLQPARLASRRRGGWPSCARWSRERSPLGSSPDGTLAPCTPPGQPDLRTSTELPERSSRSIPRFRRRYRRGSVPIGSQDFRTIVGRPQIACTGKCGVVGAPRLPIRRPLCDHLLRSRRGRSSFAPFVHRPRPMGSRSAKLDLRTPASTSSRQGARVNVGNRPIRVLAQARPKCLA
jgi:hypothetical protein